MTIVLYHGCFSEADRRTGVHAAYRMFYRLGSWLGYGFRFRKAMFFATTFLRALTLPLRVA